MEKPFNQAANNNKEAIVEQLCPLLKNSKHVLEIGSGTGQHAVHFAPLLNHLTWQPSDLPENLPGMSLWFDEANIKNILSPIELDVTQKTWPSNFDAVFTANTFHIMPWPIVQITISETGNRLSKGGLLIVYGPFKYDGKFTTESNANFNLWLKDRQPHYGIREFNEISQLAQSHGLVFQRKITMPANNEMLVWEKE